MCYWLAWWLVVVCGILLGQMVDSLVAVCHCFVESFINTLVACFGGDLINYTW